MRLPLLATDLSFYAINIIVMERYFTENSSIHTEFVYNFEEWNLTKF